MVNPDLESLRRQVRSGQRSVRTRTSPPTSQQRRVSPTTSLSHRPASTGNHPNVLWIIPLLLVVALLSYCNGGQESSDELVSSRASENPRAVYRDTYISTEEIRVKVTSKANARDWPTSKNSEVVGFYKAGRIFDGKWVQGRDPTTRWLRVEYGSQKVAYVWEGNLKEVEIQQQKVNEPKTKVAESNNTVSVRSPQNRRAQTRQSRSVDQNNRSDLPPTISNVQDVIDKQPRLRGGTRGFSASSYPSRALREGREGSTSISLSVGTNGRANNCRVTESSGHSDLDAATCKNAERSLRFYPATDVNGLEVVDEWSTTVRWQIP